MIGTELSAKCARLRVAKVAWWASTMPAIIVSRRSPGRPRCWRAAINAAACCAASASKDATRWLILSRSPSKAWTRADRRFPAAMICNPNRTSRTVMEVVQMDVRGCWSSHATTFRSGDCCISAESTLVSRMVTRCFYLKRIYKGGSPEVFVSIIRTTEL
jgi:hypothetical protein